MIPSTDIAVDQTNYCRLPTVNTDSRPTTRHGRRASRSRGPRIEPDCHSGPGAGTRRVPGRDFIAVELLGSCPHRCRESPRTRLAKLQRVNVAMIPRTLICRAAATPHPMRPPCPSSVRMSSADQCPIFNHSVFAMDALRDVACPIAKNAYQSMYIRHRL